MKIFLIAVALACYGTNVRSQTESDSLDRDNYYFILHNRNEYIYNRVYKNIAAYNIRYASRWFNDLYFSYRSSGDNDKFFEYVLPDYGYKLKMDIVKLDSAYPNPNLHLYKIYLGNFEFIPDNHDRPVISGSFPRTLHHFLIALNENTGDIKFVSGQFFKSYISRDFKIDKNDPESLNQYLKMRTFDVGGMNIKFKKKRHKKWIFEGYSAIYKRPLTITVNRKDIDQVETVVNPSIK